MPDEPLLRVENLLVAYAADGKERPVLRGVTFALSRGETVGLMGESGCGKTTLALAIARLLPPAARAEGTVRFRGRDVGAMCGRELRRLRSAGIATIFQEPALALHPLMRIEDQVAEAAAQANPNWDRGRRRAEAREALSRTGLDDERLRRSYPHELSGGQRQRVSIAQALVRHPAMIIADEPAAALDAAAQAGIVALFAEFKQRLGLTTLLISHDPSLIEALADRVLAMSGGRLEEAGGVMPGAADRGAPRQERVDAGGAVTLEAVGIRKTYAGRRWFGRDRPVAALSGVNLTLRRGRTLAVTGASGSGKSTLARCLARLTEMDAGEVWLAGRNFTALDARETRRARRGIQWIPQDPGASLNPRFAAEDIVAEPLLIQRECGRAEARRRAREWMERIGLDPARALWRPGRFSGGQRARLALARALTLSPGVLILDESLSSLDRAAQARMVELLRGLQRAYGLSYLLIAHDARLVEEWADEVVALDAGKVMEEQRPKPFRGDR